MRTSDFYNYYIGCAVPDTLMKWVRIQEHFLATCTSGEVFEDGLGEFTAIRSALLPCYPEDVRLKKLRRPRGDDGAVGAVQLPAHAPPRRTCSRPGWALGEFLNAALSMLYLLNFR